MAVAILSKKKIEEVKNLGKQAASSVKSALIVAGVALVVGVIALVVSLVK